MPRTERTKLAFYENGARQAEAIVMLHGLPLNAGIWQPLTTALQDNFRCISYDLRGFGSSEHTDEYLTLETHVDDLFVLLKRCRIRRAWLCGHDLGGHIALRAIERDAKRFLGLILCSALPGPPSKRETLEFSRYLQRLRTEGSRRIVADLLQARFDLSAADSSDSPYERLLEEGGRLDPDGLAGGLLAMLTRTDTRATFERFDRPRLMIAGSSDTITPADDFLQLGLSVSGLKFTRVPGVGHIPPVEYPAFTVGSIIRFLKSTKR